MDPFTAGAERLGTPVKEYQAKEKQPQRIGCLLSAVVGTGLVVGYGAYSDAQSQHWGGMIGLSIVALALIAPPLFALAYVRLKGRISSVSVYPDGLLVHRGRRTFTTRWDEAKTLNFFDTGLRLVKSDGQVIYVEAILADFDELAETVADRTLQLMLPEAKAALERGASVEFASWSPVGRLLGRFARAGAGFSVDATSIRELDGERRIAWSDVTKARLADGTFGLRYQQIVRLFAISDGNQTFETRVDFLCNAHVLFALLNELVKPEAREVVAQLA